MKGESLFLGLEPGNYELSIDAADFRPLRKKVKINGKINRFSFILQDFSTGGMKGNIRLFGTGVFLPDAELKLTAVHPDETGAEEFSFWTDWDGNYAASSIPIGEYEYLVNAPFCEPMQGRLAIEKDIESSLNLDVKPIPDHVKINVNVKTDSGVTVKKSRVRLLEGMGVVILAEKDCTDTCVFRDFDRAPFNQVQSKEKPFIGRNFVVAADIKGYHTGYGIGSLRSDNECDVEVICQKVTTDEALVRGIEESKPAEIPLNERINVQILCKKKERLLKITLPHPGNVIVKAGPNPYNTFLRILDNELKVLTETWNYANNSVERTVQSKKGELLIGISGDISDNTEILCSLVVDYQPIIDPYSPNNSFESALPVEFGEILRPFMFPQDNVDYFMVAVKRPGILRVRLSDFAINARIRILNPQAEEIVNTWNYANTTIDTSCSVYKPGLYRIALSANNQRDFSLEPTNLKIDFLGTESNPEDFVQETTPLKPVRIGKWFSGTLFPEGKYNRYRFSLDRTGFIKIRFHLSDCNSRLRLLNSQGKEIYSAWNYGGESLNPDIYIYESGEYFIEVSGASAPQRSQESYFISVFFYPNDEYEAYKGNDFPKNAAEIYIGQEVTGTIGNPGDIDYYKFYVAHPGILTQSTGTFPISLHFIVNDPQGKEIFNSLNYAGENLNQEYHVLNRGYYMLRIFGTSSNAYSPVSYSFRLEIILAKPESVKAKNKLVLPLNSGIKLDALIPGSIKSFILPVTTPEILMIGAKIPINARLIINDSDGKELFNSWNYAGNPLQNTLTQNDPTTLQFMVQGTSSTEWSKECYYIYATGGGAIPPEPVLTLESISKDNRTVLFNVSGTSAGRHTVTNYEMDFEGRLAPNGFVSPAFVDLNYDFEENDKEWYTFYESYSICSIPVIYTISEKHPEAGALAPCTMYFYQKKGEKKMHMGFPSVQKWISAMNMDDKKSIDTLLEAEKKFKDILAKVTK